MRDEQAGFCFLGKTTGLHKFQLERVSEQAAKQGRLSSDVRNL